MEFVPNEKAFTQRAPSTANLMVDSKDRDLSGYAYCNDFLIFRKQSLMNGFFTRVGTTEMVMEWFYPNVSQANGNDLIEYTTDVSGAEFNIFLSGFYTVAGVLNVLVNNLNDVSGTTTLSWSVLAAAGGGAVLQVRNNGVASRNTELTGPLIQALNGGFNITETVGPGSTRNIVIHTSNVDLRSTRYVDIVCTQLTNNQSVKDGSTARSPRDVICRWYFDYDNQNPLDEYGFPVLMGYTPFCIRRTFNPPKQIQWQANIPIGQMAFQMYGDDGELQPVNRETNFLMTLQASEN